MSNTKTFGKIEAKFDDKFNNCTFIARDCVSAFSGNGAKYFDAEERNGRSTWNALFILDDDVAKDVQAIYEYMVKEHLNGVTPRENYFSLKDGNSFQVREGDYAGEVRRGFEDKKYIKAINNTTNHDAPLVYSKQHDIIESLDGRVFRDGSKVDVQFRAYAYNGENKGVSAVMEIILMVEEGEAFSGGERSPIDGGAVLGGREPEAKSSEDVFG